MKDGKMEKRAKLFPNGHSQAVRLPKEFRFEGTEVKIRREGNCVVLEPVGPQIPARDLEKMRALLKTLEPMDAELSARMDEAMQKLQGA